MDLITITDSSYVFQGTNTAKLTLSGVGPSSIVSSGGGFEIQSTLPIVLNGTCEIRNSTGIATFSSIISGSGGLETHGFTVIDGTSANTFTGTTYVSFTTGSGGSVGSLTLGKSAGLR